MVRRSDALYAAIIVWSIFFTGSNGNVIRQHPSASFIPSSYDRVIDLPSKKEQFGGSHLDKKAEESVRSFALGGEKELTEEGKAEVESKLRSILGSPEFENHDNPVIRKLLDLMFQDMERKSRPRYG